MDFVDLDRVLDEFEEEEKAALSIVPGEELKPSGYIEFLEKHENQAWESVTTDMSNHKYNLSSSSSGVRDQLNVSYDEPYDCYTPSKLDSVQDGSLSPNVGKADQLVITGERVRGLKDHVENRSKRGTIASKTIMVQTDALSPTTERELSSLPFPKSDIIVEGHVNSFSQDEDISLAKNHHDQNNSPIYASVDSNRLFSSSSDLSIISSNTSSLQSGFITETKASFSQYSHENCDQGEHLKSTQQVGVNSESVIGFQDMNVKDLDECELNVYLNEIEREDLLGVNNSHMNLDINSVSNRHIAQDTSSSVHNLNIAVRDQALKLNNLTNTEFQNDIGNDNTKEMRTSQLNCQTEDRTLEELIQQDQNRVYNSLIYGKTVIEDIIDGKKNLTETVDDSSDYLQKKGDNSIYEQLMFDKMEIESLLNEAVKNQHARLVNDSESNVSVETHFSNSTKQIGDNMSSGLVMPNNYGCDLKIMNGIVSNENLSFPMNNIDEKEFKLNTSNVAGDNPMYTGIGARPKDPSVLRKNRPSSLVGLSKVNLDLPSPSKTLDNNTSVIPQSKQLEDSISQQMVTESVAHQVYSDHEALTVNDSTQRMNLTSDNIAPLKTVPSSHRSNEHSDDISDNIITCQQGEDEIPNGSDGLKKMSRPTTLNLPSRPDFDMANQLDEEAMEVDPCADAKPTEAEPEAAASASNPPADDDLGLQSEAAADAPRPVPQRNLGEVAPFWVPDTDAETCMTCGVKFTLWKRRHHCRACGKVLCSQCCSQKSFLRYMDNKEARVCVECFLDLSVAMSSESSPRSPNPNNPSEYCSKIPPNQQATNQGAPPTVMVPTGVLKSSGRNRRSEPKQVMFSDGIRPGGDLTELDGEDHTRSHRRSNRAARKAAQQQSQNAAKKLKSDSLSRSPCLVPASGLPPLYILEGEKGHVEMDEALNQLDYTEDYRMEGGPSIYYAVNKNLAVAVKLVNLDCCMNRVCWSFVSRGMASVGQRELIILLELTEEEASSPSIKPPQDIFLHFHYLYEEALKGFTIQDMGHTILHQSFLGSRDHGGFLYVQPTFQCLSKLSLPETPFAFGILLQKWEAPWAKVFPIRLLLRLGAEFRYYPCPLISVRNRKPVFYEIGHTIMNLLADFRNFQYSLSQIRGVTIHMEDKKTVISLPRNRYNDIMKVVRSSNEHVMAFGSSFSSVADSHLVCIQNEEGNYQTQAINIQNKPRQVTGASFVVFNGALKASSGLRAKSSIVEDGVMVQVLPEAMANLKQVLKDMTDHKISCGPVDASEPDEVLEIQWTDNDNAFNIGVKSYIDGMSLEGIESVSVKSTSDFVGKDLAIRWTRVYFLRQETSTHSHFDPVDLTRLTEEIAQACCTALVPHLEELRNLEQIKIGLRVNLTRDAVGYEIGSKGQGFPEKILTSLDTCLIPIIHQASEDGMILELVFHILD